jgi:hypothetical protein
MEGSQGPRRSTTYNRRGGYVWYDGFKVPRENLTRSKCQLAVISVLTVEQKQFIGTMIDTEVAVGYFLRKSNVSGGIWVAYLAVKMKYGGDLKYFAKLISHIPPGRHLYANTIKGLPDLRWSLQVQGVVAFALLRETRSFLHNEKSITEVDCILKHGPIIDALRPHPFVDCGASRIRRGVWYWPRIDDAIDPGRLSTGAK